MTRQTIRKTMTSIVREKLPRPTGSPATRQIAVPVVTAAMTSVTSAASTAGDSGADSCAADAEMTAPGAQSNRRDNVIRVIVVQQAFLDLRVEIKQLLSEGSAAAAEGILSGA